MPVVAVTCSPSRKFDFGFAEVFGERFAALLAADWAAAWIDVTPRTPDTALYALRDWLKWLSSGKSVAGIAAVVRRELVAAMRSGKAAAFDEDLFLDLCERYSQQFRDDTAGALERKMNYDKLRCFGRCMRKICGRTALPPLRRGLCSIGAGSHDREGHPPLAALTKSGVVDWSSSGEMAEALAPILRDAKIRYGGLSLDAQLSAVAALNHTRLTRLRELLEGELLAERDAFEYGLRLMADPSLPEDAEIVSVMSGRGGTDGAQPKWFRRVVLGKLERRIALILRYCRAQGGVVRGLANSTATLFLPEGAIRSLLGAEPGRVAQALQRMLSITPVSWNAAFGLLLIDTAWNVQPLAELPVDPFVGAVSQGKRRLATAHLIRAFKRRARHEVNAALVDLTEGDKEFLDEQNSDSVAQVECVRPSGISGYEVVRLVQKMSAPVRARSTHPGLLWICPRGHSSVSFVPSPYARTLYWLAFIERHKNDPIIGGLPIRRAMIRKTRIDITAMDQEGGHAVAIALGEHSSGISMKRYRRSPWLQHVLMENIRTFQNSFEAALIQDLSAAHEHLSIPRGVLESRLEFATTAGLGLLASSSSALPAEDVGPAIRFVPDRESLLTLHIARRTLRRTAPILAKANSVRWKEFWLPLLVRTEAVVAALRESPYARLSGEAAERATGNFALGAVNQGKESPSCQL